jgi:hypoxanthine phosphoribosyltransferase
MPRGGLIPAVLLSYKLNIPLIIDEDDINEYTLIVDDLIDKGETLKRFFKHYDIATIHCKEHSPVSNYYYEIKPSNEWIVYPWEA